MYYRLDLVTQNARLSMKCVRQPNDVGSKKDIRPSLLRRPSSLNPGLIHAQECVCAHKVTRKPPEQLGIIQQSRQFVTYALPSPYVDFRVIREQARGHGRANFLEPWNVVR
jgi:hypothetical protein